MVVGYVWLHKQYPARHWIAGLLAVIGLTACLRGGLSAEILEDTHGGSSPLGVLLVVAALAFDGLYANTQEQLMWQFASNVAEINACSMGIAALLFCVSALFSGDLVKGFLQAYSNADLLPWLAMFLLANFAATWSALELMRVIGAASTGFTSAVCKALNIAVNYAIFPKAIYPMQVYGMTMVIGAVMLVTTSSSRAPLPGVPSPAAKQVDTTDHAAAEALKYVTPPPSPFGDGLRHRAATVPKGSAGTSSPASDSSNGVPAPAPAPASFSSAAARITAFQSVRLASSRTLTRISSMTGIERPADYIHDSLSPFEAGLILPATLSVHNRSHSVGIPLSGRPTPNSSPDSALQRALPLRRSLSNPEEISSFKTD
jgi:hypothetical protein